MMDQDFLNKFSIKDVVNQGLPVWVHLVETAITANIKSKLSIAPYWNKFLGNYFKHPTCVDLPRSTNNKFKELFPKNLTVPRNGFCNAGSTKVP